MINKITKLLLSITLIVSAYSFTNAQNQQKQQTQQPSKSNHDMMMMSDQPNSCPKSIFGIPDLTPEQTSKIEDLKLQHIKDVTPLKDQLKEKQARINTLLDADKSDMVSINAAIDEFSGITNQLIKKKAEFRLSIRNILTDKQKIIYDSKSDLFAKNECCPNGEKKGNKCRSGQMQNQNHGEYNCPQHK